MTARSLDKHGRCRSKTAAFRMSPEEAEQLYRLAAISGLSKQDYLIARVFNREVTVMPSSRVQKKLREGFDRTYRGLRRISKAGELSDEFLEVLEVMAKEYAGFGQKDAMSDVELEEDVMLNFDRSGNTESKDGNHAT